MSTNNYLDSQTSSISSTTSVLVGKSPKRVAYIGLKGLPAQAGVDRVVEAIITHLDCQKYAPTVYVSADVVPTQVQIPGVTLIRVPSLPGRFLKASSLFLFAAIHSVLFGHYDIVHLHGIEASFVLPLLRIRYKVISTSHGATHRRVKWGWFPRLLFLLSEVPFIYLSNQITCVAEPLTERYERLYRRKVHFIGNGVETEDVDEEGAKAIMQAHGLTAGNYIMFSAGRILETKGCHYLLEAYRELKTDLPLIISGNASHVPAYTSRLHQLADDRVHFIDFLPSRKTTLGLVRNAKLFVFPSTYEGMSMMLLEVLSLDVAFLCSNIPENVKIVSEQELMFESGNVTSLRAKLEWALSELDSVKELSQSASEYIFQEYSWESLSKEYEKLYDHM